MTEQFANFAQSSLAAPITALQTSISVASPFTFPALGNFRIVVQSFDVTTQIPTSAPELMLVTAVQGKQFTVTRGIEGTQAIAFDSGAMVNHIVTAGVMQAISSGSGSTPGGTNDSIQFNNSGTFDGFGNWDGSTFSVGGNLNASLLTGQYTNAAGSAFINPDGSAVFAGGSSVINNIGAFTGLTFNGFLATGNISQWTNDAGYTTNAAGLFVNNATDSTLILSGAGPYTLGLDLGNTNIWTASQTWRAGTTAANTAGQYLQSGPLATTAQVGAEEFLTDKRYFTITTGAARKEYALWDSAGTSGRVPYETTNGRLIDSAGLEFSTVGGQILTLGGTTSGIGKLVIQGNTSGAITIQPQTSSGTYNFNLPITAGSTGQPLISQGGGSTAMTFGTLGLTGGGTGTSSISSGSANGVICLNSSGNAFVATSSGNTSPQTYLAGGGSGSPTFQQVQAISLNLSSFTLGTTNGGTGRSAAYTIGDILYASSSSLVGVIAAVATGSILVSNGTSTNPIYSSSPSLGGKFAKYNNITTAGWGIPAIYAAGRSVAQSAAVASVSTYTVGAADGSFEISANVLVTASTLHNFTVTCAYTDEGNTARTLTLSFSQLAGTFLTSIANAGGTVPYEGIPLHIRCKASTSITIATTGTFTTVTYNVEGIIKQTA